MKLNKFLVVTKYYFKWLGFKKYILQDNNNILFIVTLVYCNYTIIFLDLDIAMNV